MKPNIQLYHVPKVHSIQDMIFQSAKKYEFKLALEDLNNTPIKKVTYGELADYILRFGNALTKIGLKERAHIALIGENRVQWSISYLTLMSFNYVVVPIDKNLTQNEILNIIHESDAEAIIFSETFAEMLTGLQSSLKKLRLMQE